MDIGIFYGTLGKYFYVNYYNYYRASSARFTYLFPLSLYFVYFLTKFRAYIARFINLH